MSREKDVKRNGFQEKDVNVKKVETHNCLGMPWHPGGLARFLSALPFLYRLPPLPNFRV